MVHTKYFRVLRVPAFLAGDYQPSSGKRFPNPGVSCKFVCPMPNYAAFDAAKSTLSGRGRLKCFSAAFTSTFNATISVLVGFAFANVRAVLSCLPSVRYVSKLSSTLLAGFCFFCHLCFPFAGKRAILGGVESIFGDVKQLPAMSAVNFFSGSRFSHAA